MREYELYLVMDAEIEEDALSATIEKLTQLISIADGEEHGQVIKVDTRGKRRLAYPIRRRVEGQDVIFTFQTSPQALVELERVLKLNEQVYRYLLVRTDEV